MLSSAPDLEKLNDDDIYNYSKWSRIKRYFLDIFELEERRRNRLLSEIQSTYSLVKKMRGSEGFSIDKSLEDAVKDSLQKAATALQKGNIDEGWKLLTTANSKVVYGFDEYLLRALAKELKLEVETSEEITSWRKAAILELIKEITEETDEIDENIFPTPEEMETALNQQIDSECNKPNVVPPKPGLPISGTKTTDVSGSHAPGQGSASNSIQKENVETDNKISDFTLFQKVMNTVQNDKKMRFLKDTGIKISRMKERQKDIQGLLDNEPQKEKKAILKSELDAIESEITNMKKRSNRYLNRENGLDKKRIFISRAIKLRDDEVNAKYYSIGLLKDQMAVLIWIMFFTIMGLFFFFWHFKSLNFSAPFTTNMEMIPTVMLLGILGAGFSAMVTPFVTRHYQIPEQVNAYSITLLRVGAGSLSALIILIFLVTGIFNYTPTINAQVYAFSIVSGISEKLVKDAAEKIGGKLA